MSIAAHQSQSTEFDREILVNGSEPVSGSVYGRNLVGSSWYNASSFIPMNLYKQFHKLASVWFLFVSILQLSPYNPYPLETYSTVAPLCLLLFFTLFKDGYIDYLRHKEDAQHNNQIYSVWDGGKYLDKMSKDLQVGEIMLIREDETVPADIVILAASDLDQKCYVDTSFVLGEERLECKLALPDTQNIIEYTDQMEVSSSIRRIIGQIHVGHPSRDVSKFDGKLKLRGNPVAIPLSIENLLLKGSIIKFTPWTLGVIIYTGYDTKLLMNAKAKRMKTSRTEHVLNLWVIGLIIVIMILMMISMMLYNLAYSHVQSWNEDSDVNMVVYYILLLHHIVPIPLFLGIDIIRSLQAITITKAMKNEVSFKTTDLNEDLGKVEYIIADKSGTITTGELLLKAVSIGDSVYWNDYKDQDQDYVDEIKDTERNPVLYNLEKEPNYEFMFNGGPTGENGVIYYNFRELISEIATKEWNAAQCHLFRCMALNNSVQPLNKEQDAYFSTSYEEQALVKEAECFGFKLVSKTTELCLLEEFGVFVDYDIIAYKQYKKETPKSRIVVKRSEQIGGILYVKGHPHEIIKNCIMTNDHYRHFQDHLSILSSKGLRTMAFAYKIFKAHDLEEFIRKLDIAKSSPINSVYKIEELYQEFEKELHYAGLTGLEEFVSLESKAAINNLQAAGIKIWIASGDGRNNTFATAKNANIIPHDMPVAILHNLTTEIQAFKYLKKNFNHYIYHESSIPLSRCYSFIPHSRMDAFIRKCTNQDSSNYSHDGDKEVRPINFESADPHRLEIIHPLLNQLTKLEIEAQSGINKQISPKSIRYSVVIDSVTFDTCMKNETTRTLLVTFLFSAQSVVFSNLLPHHKAEVVKMLKDNLTFKPITLAIGDSTCDIAMILEADIGISCKKDTQLSNYSDIIIQDFSLLSPLLLKHGHWNYFRMDKTIYLFMYKNFLLAVIRFLNEFYVGYSSAGFINCVLTFSSNYVLTSIPIIWLGVLEQKHCSKSISSDPRIYINSILSKHLRVKRLIRNLLFACLHGALIYFFIIQGTILNSKGMPESLTLIDTTIFITIILVVLLQIVSKIKNCNRVYLAIILVPIILMILEIAMLNEVAFINNEHFSDIWNISKCPVYIIIILTVPLLCFLTRYVKRAIRLLRNKLQNRVDPQNGNFITFYHPRLYNLKYLTEIYKKHEKILSTAEKEAYYMDKVFLTFNSKHAEKDYKLSFYNENIKSIRGLLFASVLSIIVWTMEEIFVYKNGKAWFVLAIIVSALAIIGIIMSKFKILRIRFIESIFSIAVTGMAFEFIYQMTTGMINLELSLFIAVMTFIMINIDFKKICIINLINIIRTMIVLLAKYHFTIDQKEDSILVVILFLWRVVLLISVTAISANIGYKLEESLRTYFKILKTTEIEVQKSKSILGFLLPQFVIKRVNDGVRYIAEDQGTASVLFCDICDFDTICSEYEPQELTAFLDDLFKKFDQLCQSFGVTKIETVGKTYMACAGLRDSEIDFDPKLREINHARRVLELGFSMIHCVTEMHTNLDNPLQIKIGVNSGPVVAGVVGFHKPQFSLVGDTVNTASRMCSLNNSPNSIQISETTFDMVKEVDGFYFTHNLIEVKGKGLMETFKVKEACLAELECDLQSDEESLTTQTRCLPILSQHNPLDHRLFSQQRPTSPKTPMHNSKFSVFPDQEADSINNNSINKMHISSKKSLLEYLEVSKSTDIFRRTDSGLIEKTQILNLRCKETSVQTKFRLDYLDFYCKHIKNSIMIGFLCAICLNVFMIVRFCMTSSESTLELVGRCIITVIMITIYTQLNRIYKKAWFPLMMTIVYFLGCMIALIGIVTYSKLDFGSVEVLFYVLLMTNASGGFLRHAIWSCLAIFLYWIAIVSVYAQYEYTMTKTMYLIGFIGANCFSLYTRETQLRTHFNIKFIADKEIEKTEKLLTQMMPPHVYENLKEDKAITDRIAEVTLLYADIVGFTAWSSVNTPEDVVGMLSELFTRFDQKCVELNVYKVHTIGDCYVVIGYNGKSKRDPCQESLNVLHMAQKMIEIINDINEEYGSSLSMRIGLHTGDIIAGITGTNVIRYDIYGPDVLIANKMESNGQAGKINVSDVTRIYLIKAIPEHFIFEFNKEIEVNVVKRVHKCYFISSKEQD